MVQVYRHKWLLFNWSGKDIELSSISMQILHELIVICKSLCYPIWPWKIGELLKTLGCLELSGFYGLTPNFSYAVPASYTMGLKPFSKVCLHASKPLIPAPGIAILFSILLWCWIILHASCKTIANEVGERKHCPLFLFFLPACSSRS